MDIGILWSNDGGDGQWIVANGDLLAGHDLTTSVLVSLFTDAYATDDFTPTDGTQDRRGWWGNSFETTPIGCNLWQLDRAYYSDRSNILLSARDFVKSCLQWMIDDGVVATISVQTAKLGISGLGIGIILTQPVTNAKRAFNFSYYWGQRRTTGGDTSGGVVGPITVGPAGQTGDFSAGDFSDDFTGGSSGTPALPGGFSSRDFSSDFDR